MRITRETRKTMIATPNTRRRKICTGLKLKPRTMSAFVVGVLRSAMRLPSPNASASASGGVESAPSAATLNVGVAGEDATPASVGLDPSFCCEIEGASPCSIGFAAAGEDAATASVGLDRSTCSALSCGMFSCETEGGSPCSIGFAAAGEDTATAWSVWMHRPVGHFLAERFLVERDGVLEVAFAAAGEDAATASVGLDASTCRAFPCGTFSCGTEGASPCSIGFAAAGEDAATASVGLDPSTCSALSLRNVFLWNRRRITLLDRFCGCG